MPSAESGHMPNRVYWDADGNLHMNGASIYLDEVGAAWSPTEAGYVEGVTPGTVLASKAVVVDANKDISAFRNVVATNYDAGASGTAGTFDVFPATALKGKIQLAAANNAADHTIIVTNASFGQAATITLPDPGAAAASFVLTVGTQSISGAKTFTGGVTIGTVGVTITDVDVALSATTGTKWGTATTQKQAFYNSTPIVQPSAYTQTYATADKTHANPQATALGDLVATQNTGWGASTEAGFDSIATKFDLLVLDMADLKQLVNSVIDDLQALGLVG